MLSQCHVLCFGDTRGCSAPSLAGWQGPVPRDNPFGIIKKENFLLLGGLGCVVLGLGQVWGRARAAKPASHHEEPWIGLEQLP